MMASIVIVSENAGLKALDGRYRQALHAFFRRRCRNPADAEDLTQEVFVRILRRDESAPVDHLDRYIFQIAANLLRDEARRGVTRHIAQHVEYSQPDGGAQPDRNLIDSLDPYRIAEARDTLSHSLAALLQLGERTRDIFVLSRVEKFKHKEIADMMGISVSAVEKHLVKALMHLVTCMPSS